MPVKMQENVSNKEQVMFKSVKIETAIEINGQRADNITEDMLVNMIEFEMNNAKRLEKLLEEIKGSSALTRIQLRHLQNVDKLVKIMEKRKNA